MKVKNDKATNIFKLIGYIFVIGFAVFCVVPFILMMSGSLSSDSSVIQSGYSFFPKDLTLNAYTVIFSDPAVVLHSYGVSLFVTIMGTLVSLLVCSMAAYALCRKDFKYRNIASFILYFTTLFGGGLVPYYIIVVKYLHLKDKLIVLIITGLVNVFNILILRNFMKNDISDALPESAKIDGAGEFRIYWSIVMPLMKPALASIGLFIALGYWNDWWTAMMFVEKPNLSPIQYTLYKMLNTINFLLTASSNTKAMEHVDLPTETVKLSMAVITALPIMMVYPFVQKYFVKGITIGAVKG